MSGAAEALAQASRLLRYCRELGLTDEQIIADVEGLDLKPIQDESGVIVPEPQDYAHEES